MTLTELEQVKQDVANGVIVNKSTWLKVLDTAIEASEDLYALCAAEASYAACSEADE